MNIFFGSPKSDAEILLVKRGYKVAGKNRRAAVIIRQEGREHLGDIMAELIAERGGKRFVVHAVRETDDPTEPALRRRLVELDRAFGLNGILLVNVDEGAVNEISFRFPRERGLEFYFQFLIGLFIVGAVIGIIWLMVWLKLF